MSKPTTEAGRALMEAMLRRGRWWASPGDTIVAIEAEAAAQERERIAREIALVLLPLAEEDESPAALVYREARAAVLALIEETA